MTTTTTVPRLLTYAQAAELLGMTPAAVQRAAHRGTIPVVRLTPRTRRIPAAWVEERIDEALQLAESA